MCNGYTLSKFIFVNINSWNLESSSPLRRVGGDASFKELMSHLALITTLQITSWVIKCLRMCVRAVWQESHTAVCSIDSTCNQFGAAQLLWCNELWNVHMTSTQGGNPELTPVKLCTSHMDRQTASMLFTKDWLCRSCWSRVEFFRFTEPLTE